MRLAVLDTDSAIYAMGGQYPALRAQLEAREPGTVVLSAVTFAEIAIGVAAGKLADRTVLDHFIKVIPVLPFDQAAAEAYATLPFKRARFDRLLAAHAISLGATLVTNNGRDFGDIHGLTVENWTL